MPSRSDGVLVALVIRNPRALEIAKRWRYALDAITIFFAVQITIGGRLMQIWERLLGERFPPLKQSFSRPDVCADYPENISLRESYISAMLRQVPLVGGAISFALYMYNQAVNGLVRGYFFNDAPTITSWEQLFAAVCVVTMTFLLAALSYTYLEMP